MNQSKYYTTKEAANILGRSIRSTNYHLQYLFDIKDDAENPPAVRMKSNGIWKCFYRKDWVDKSINKKKNASYRRTCRQCSKKFVPINNEYICKDCSSVDDNPMDEYDPIACKALYMVLTDPNWYRLATRLVIIGWLLALTFVLGGCYGWGF